MSEDEQLVREREPDTGGRTFLVTVGDVLANLVQLAGSAAATVLVTHVILTIADANPDNGLTRFVAEWADRLSFGVDGLFTPADETVRIAVNHGVAALLWIVVTAVVVRFLRRRTSPYEIS